MIPSGEAWGEVDRRRRRRSFAWTVVVYETPNALVVIVPSIETFSLLLTRMERERQPADALLRDRLELDDPVLAILVRGDVGQLAGRVVGVVGVQRLLAIERGRDLRGDLLAEPVPEATWNWVVLPFSTSSVWVGLLLFANADSGM